MASQAELQSLIQTLTGVQTTGQSNVPSGVNNGNPNTIFNVASPAAPTAWDFSYSAPMDARPIWDGNMNLSPIVAPPPTPIPPPSTGGNLPPNPTTGGGGGGGSSNTGGTGGGNSIIGGNGPGSVTSGRVSNALTQAGAAQGLRWTGTTFVNQNGSGLTMPQWQQLVDMGLDLIGLDGNWYLAGTGGWDASNILASLLGSFTGLPINSIMTMIGRYGAERGWSENNVFVDHYMDNVQNALDNFQKTLNQKVTNQTNQIGDSNLQNTLNYIQNLGLQGNALTNPSSLTRSQWNTLLSGTSVGGQLGGLAFMGLGGIGDGTTNGGTGNLATGGIFGGGSGNFGPGGSGGSFSGGGMPSTVQNSGYYGVITDPDAIASFMQGMAGFGQIQTGADWLGRKYEK